MKNCVFGHRRVTLRRPRTHNRYIGHVWMLHQMVNTCKHGHQEPQIREVVSRMPSRQTMLFTATWGKDVQKVARTLVKGEPTRVSFGDAASGKLTANKDVTQTIEIVESWRDKKTKAIERLKELHKDTNAKTIVFLATKRACDEVANELWYAGLKCDSIHGDKEQRERDRVIGQFRRNEVMVLVATDVAARGLDVSDVTNVVQIDFPAASGKAGVEDYIHRIGRTGRAGRKGSAHAYLTKDDIKANGRVLAFDGWTRVGGVAASDEQVLPTFEKGDETAPFSIEPKQKFSSPPPRYNEGSLVKKLEDEGINAMMEQFEAGLKVSRLESLPPDLAAATVLRIDPKMAFGTGYHETTRLCLRLLAECAPEGGRVLDLGTGTGCILLTLLAERTAATGIGTDLSEAALAVATRNRDALGLEGRATLGQPGPRYRHVPQVQPRWSGAPRLVGAAPGSVRFR